GGGGFMVIYLAKTGRVVTLDGRETCPAACTPTLFVNPRTGKPYLFQYARHSGISVGVPGMVATWDRALREYGTRSLGANLGPAIATARRGFLVDPTFRAQAVDALPAMQAFTSTRQLFLTKAGQPLPNGYRLRNPDLAKTYTLLARHGADYLYNGPIGRAIVDTVRRPPVWSGTRLSVMPGRMTMADVRAYRAIKRSPTHVTYRGRDVYGMAPPSSGGSTVGEALNILSGWNLGSEPRAQALFHYLEASRLAYADRNAYVGDPAYVDVPLRGLLSPAFAATRRCLVGNTALTSPLPPGDPRPPYAGCDSAGARAATPPEGAETNHLVTADRWGNVVSYTNTIEQNAGSGMTVPGYGFLLNNELTDFSFAPATPGAYDPNLPAPGKRPRSSMSPTIVLRDGVPDFAVGSPGGSTIVTTVLQTILNHVDFGMSLPAAVFALRASQRNEETTLVESSFYRTALRRQLERRYGEAFTDRSTTGKGPLYRVIGNATGLDFLGNGVVQAVAERDRLGGGSALVAHPR
ncbi:MAG: gamma-glutamyltransferase, partial [Frankiaceae bacterium]